jgi:hypothetical protein
MALREEHILRMQGSRVLRRTFGQKRDEMAEGWRRLHNMELHNLYFSPIRVRMFKTRYVRWEVHVAQIGRR